MREHRFACVACGKCCAGWLPLTLDDAVAHAGRFPLALMWTAIRPENRSHDLAARLGTIMDLGGRKRVAIRVSPISYIPPAFDCPALTTGGLCSIHDDKPLRCRAMPFFAGRDEADQADLLIPRAGWVCDTSEAAPVVYRDKRIVARADFERERAALEAQAPPLRRYADWMLAAAPELARKLATLAARPAGGHLVVNFSTLLPRLKAYDTVDFARRQVPVLAAFADRVAGDPGLVDYLKCYRETAADLERVLRRPTEDRST